YADAAEFIDAVEAAFDIHDARPVRLTRPARTESDEVAPADRTQVATTFIPTTVVDQRRPRSWRWAAVAAIAIVIIAAASFVAWRRAEAAKIAAFGKFYAVVIGEGKYQHMEPLTTAVDDARAVHDLLQSKYGFQVTPLYDATQQQILATLRAVSQKMTPNDNLLVFYAGHGSIDTAGKGYWRPVDDDLEMLHAISPALMKDVLIDQPSRRTLIIADS